MLSKISRQLIVFHIIYVSEVIELIEITNLTNVSAKTISRDIKELRNAGLINIRFSKREKGYVHIDRHNRCPFLAPILTNSKKKGMHIEKLIRLVTIMVDLADNTESLYYGFGTGNQETCSSWYKNQFPHLSTRTMQRDFKELRKIGYNIYYYRSEGCYVVDFPDDLEGIIGINKNFF